MPVIHKSDYRPHFLLRNKHINTIAPSFFRKIKDVIYERKRIHTPDHDFLDLDFSCVGSHSIVIIIHGLEGHSYRPYMKGMIRAANNANWDAVALNLRGCSGEPNILYSSYHSGKTDDLDLVVNYLAKDCNYSNIMIIGFSIGGNITLKYVGEKSSTLSKVVSVAAAVSVPCSLEDSSNQLAKSSNYVYMKTFLNTLKKKALFKKMKSPNANISDTEIKKSKNFLDFDNICTAPMHGFKDAKDYWTQSSCRQFLPNISIPTLLITAKDDPFLAPSCYPYEEAKKSDNFYLEVSEFGGHVGFCGNIQFKGDFWHEQRIVDFFKQSFRS